MHLTNYSINKHSANFLQDAHSGSKRKGSGSPSLSLLDSELLSAILLKPHQSLLVFPSQIMWSQKIFLFL